MIHPATKPPYCGAKHYHDDQQFRRKRWKDGKTRFQHHPNQILYPQDYLKIPQAESHCLLKIMSATDSSTYTMALLHTGLL